MRLKTSLEAVKNTPALINLILNIHHGLNSQCLLKVKDDLSYALIFRVRKITYLSQNCLCIL